MNVIAQLEFKLAYFEAAVQHFSYYAMGIRPEDVEDIKTNTMMHPHAISKVELQRCFNQWEAHWNKCVESQGDNLEIKLMFHLSIISVLINTASILILFS